MNWLNDMRYRTAASLVSFPASEGFVVYNFVSRDVISCPAREMHWLTCAMNWISIPEVKIANAELAHETIIDTFEAFAENNIILLEGSSSAQRDEEYRMNWQLGPSSAIFHFTSMNCDYLDAADSTKWQAGKLNSEPEPQAFWRSGTSAHNFSDRPQVKKNSLLELMAKRRSVRQVTQQPLKEVQIGNILYSGMGITGWTKTETLTVPLKMTPSGGARNPFEAYIWIRHSEDLKPGIYHYSAFDNAISWLRMSPDTLPSAMLQAQEWTNDMAAVIFLVSILERTTWKYQDDNAYKVVLIEAGHIAQNMMLMATSQNLTACPTAALNHGLIATTLGLEGLTHFPVYCLLIGRPSDEGIELAVPKPYLNTVAATGC
jgi:SagB-type dehydrogenase family enzyme